MVDWEFTLTLFERHNNFRDYDATFLLTVDDMDTLSMPLKSSDDPLIYGYENFEGNQFNTKSMQFSERNVINNFKFENDPLLNEIWNYGMDAGGYRMTVAYHFVDGRTIKKLI